jgi:hypothetical protein
MPYKRTPLHRFPLSVWPPVRAVAEATPSQESDLTSVCLCMLSLLQATSTSASKPSSSEVLTGSNSFLGKRRRNAVRHHTQTRQAMKLKLLSFLLTLVCVSFYSFSAFFLFMTRPLPFALLQSISLRFCAPFAAAHHAVFFTIVGGAVHTAFFGLLKRATASCRIHLSIALLHCLFTAQPSPRTCTFI